MKASSFIEMNELDNYDKVDLENYQRLIEKLIYLLCQMILDIAFVVRKPSKHNANPGKKHL